MLAERLAAQLLTRTPAKTPVAVAERLLAVQAQDQRGFRLAIRARTKGVSMADVDRALTEDRSLVLTWLNRGTLHLVRREDYPWLHLLTANERPIVTRLAQLGVEPRAADRAVAKVERALADDGPLTRAEIAPRLGTEGQVTIHLLALASARGITVRGPVAGREQAYVLVRDWLGEQEPVDRDVAVGELARRYLAGHGPADDRDLARWAGVPLRDARAGLARVAEGRGRSGSAGGRRSPRRGRSARSTAPPRLLGAFEPLLLGWASRDFLPGAERAIAGGMFSPFALVGGKVAATWRLTGDKFELKPFEPLSDEDAAALEADGARVLRYLGR